MTDNVAAPRRPNLQLIYVSDIQRSVEFYQKIFAEAPVFNTPRYVAFQVCGDAVFALWAGGPKPDPALPRYAEIGIMLPAGDGIEALYREWKADPQIVFTEDLHKDVFGMTFVIKDPDGHLIRICPID